MLLQLPFRIEDDLKECPCSVVIKRDEYFVKNGPKHLQPEFRDLAVAIRSNYRLFSAQHSIDVITPWVLYV